MSIPINSLCVECHFRKRLSLARELGDEDQAMEYAHKIMHQLLKAPPEMDSTWLGAISDSYLQEMFGLDPDRLKAEKDFSNRFVLDRLPEIEKRIHAAPALMEIACHSLPLHAGIDEHLQTLPHRELRLADHIR